MDTLHDSNKELITLIQSTSINASHDGPYSTRLYSPSTNRSIQNVLPQTYLFTHCGHSYYAKLIGPPCASTLNTLPTLPSPILPWSPSNITVSTCKRLSHPYHTVKIEYLCLPCRLNREERLAAWESYLTSGEVGSVRRRSAGVAQPLKPDVVAVNVTRWEMKEKGKLGGGEIDGWSSPAVDTMALAGGMPRLSSWSLRT
jgi:hypothetical protein